MRAKKREREREDVERKKKTAAGVGNVVQFLLHACMERLVRGGAPFGGPRDQRSTSCSSKQTQPLVFFFFLPSFLSFLSLEGI